MPIKFINGTCLGSLKILFFQWNHANYYFHQLHAFLQITVFVIFQKRNVITLKYWFPLNTLLIRCKFKPHTRISQTPGFSGINTTDASHTIGYMPIKVWLGHYYLLEPERGNTQRDSSSFLHRSDLSSGCVTCTSPTSKTQPRPTP